MIWRDLSVGIRERREAFLDASGLGPSGIRVRWIGRRGPTFRLALEKYSSKEDEPLRMSVLDVFLPWWVARMVTPRRVSFYGLFEAKDRLAIRVFAHADPAFPAWPELPAEGSVEYANLCLDCQTWLNIEIVRALRNYPYARLKHDNAHYLAQIGLFGPKWDVEEKYPLL